MNAENRRVWQVAAGDTNRSYADLLLASDVIALGPGNHGSWPDCEARMRAGGVSGKKIGEIRSFYDMRPGDVVVLRLGTTDVCGVGEVVGDPLHHEAFGDIDGWDLQHVRRVRWLWSCNGTPKRFDTHTLEWGRTVGRLMKEPVLSWLRELAIPDTAAARDIMPLPPEPSKVDIDEIGDYLFDRGTAASAIDMLRDRIGELTRIAAWYTRTGQQPSEYETVAYLVVPLLRALGWTPQKMAVEWNRVDVALFEHMPRHDQHLTVAVEVKPKGNACLTARSQAEYYASQPGRETCRRLVVTDGLRYGVFVRNAQGTFPEHPAAYLNLTRMRDSYPVLRCAGAREALLLMAADWDGSTPDAS